MQVGSSRGMPSLVEAGELPSPCPLWHATGSGSRTVHVPFSLLLSGTGWGCSSKPSNGEHCCWLAEAKAKRAHHLPCLPVPAAHWPTASLDKHQGRAHQPSAARGRQAGGWAANSAASALLDHSGAKLAWATGMRVGHLARALLVASCYWGRGLWVGMPRHTAPSRPPSHMASQILKLALLY